MPWGSAGRNTTIEMEEQLSFRDREKKRLDPLRPVLFPDLFKGIEPVDGIYRKKPRSFCLPAEKSDFNLYRTIRDDAIQYFRMRGIGWHDGITRKFPRDMPSNHLCCSQTACVNAWFPFTNSPTKLRSVLRDLQYPVKEVLPFDLDGDLPDGSAPHVSFEWIGQRNYLRELLRGRIASDNRRGRGKGFTSADFAFRFIRDDGRIQIVLGEWKYTEEYRSKGLMRFAKSKKRTDRLEIYRPELADYKCPIKVGGIDSELEGLFYDPFDQLMRLQLLARAMERNHEMRAKIVSVMHVAPKANREFMQVVTSKSLREYGTDVHGVWQNVVDDPLLFQGVYLEELLPILTRHAPPSENWASWMKFRYGEMK